MKNKTINTIILATALSVAGLTHAIAETSATTATASTEQTTLVTEDGRAKHKGGKHRGGNQFKQMGFRNLDLTDQQKEEMQAIISAHKEATTELREAHKTEMKALLENPVFDEEKAAELVAKRDEQRAAKQLSMLEIKHEMYQLLTDEQKVKYDEQDMKKNKKMKRKNG